MTSHPARAPGLPETAGLRITSQGGADGGFEISAAERAEVLDQVFEKAGATVYLDERAAAMLGDKVLDAAVDEQGRVEFALAIQP